VQRARQRCFHKLHPAHPQRLHRTGGGNIGISDLDSRYVAFISQPSPSRYFSYFLKLLAGGTSASDRHVVARRPHSANTPSRSPPPIRDILKNTLRQLHYSHEEEECGISIVIMPSVLLLHLCQWEF